MMAGAPWVLIDHALALVFAIGFPLVTTPIYRRRRAALAAGDGAVRRREYVETIAWLSSMGVATLAAWVLLDRDFSLLGLSFAAGWRASTGLLVAGALCGLLFLQARAIARDPATREAAREALEPVREFMPATRGELWLFRGVSLSAGVGEEIYYRGFLLWYLAPLLPLPWAALASSLLFGGAHIMHGAQATLRSGVLGVIFAALYLFSGSLWASMILHLAIDLTSGQSGFAAFRETSDVVV